MGVKQRIILAGAVGAALLAGGYNLHLPKAEEPPALLRIERPKFVSEVKITTCEPSDLNKLIRTKAPIKINQSTNNEAFEMEYQKIDELFGAHNVKDKLWCGFASEGRNDYDIFRVELNDGKVGYVSFDITKQMRGTWADALKFP
jgi:hypothetical protein